MSSEKIEKNKSKLIHKTLRLSPSFVAKIEAMSKKKGKKVSEIYRYYCDNSFYLPPKARAIFQKAFKEYGIEGPTFEEQLLAFGKRALSHNGVENLETEKFDCNKLCKKARQCTSNAMFDLGEIKTLNCYVSKYPYEWTTPDGRTVRLCRYMIFPNGFPHDPENPYPKCIAKQTDLHIQLPKDHIMRNPQVCWTCYKLRKKAEEQAREKTREKELWSRQPKVNWDPNSRNFSYSP